MSSKAEAKRNLELSIWPVFGVLGYLCVFLHFVHVVDYPL